MLEQDGDEHIAVHSRTGRGKTTGFVIPNGYGWPYSLVVLDVKKQTFDATAGYRHDMLHQKVFRFDPTGRDKRSHRWNPLSVIDPASDNRFDAMARQAFLLMPETGGSSNAEKFWIPAARLAFTSVALLLAELGERPLTLALVWETFARGDCQSWLAQQIERGRKNGRPFSRQVVLGISDFLGEKDGVLTDNVRRTVTATLSAFYNPQVAAATAASDFDLRRLRREKMTVYVTIAPGHIARMRELLALFFDQLINLNTDTTPEEDPALKYPVLVILDEFGLLGRIASLAAAARFVRGYGIRLAYVIQDPAQLRELYGVNGAKDILSNLGCEIMFGTNDLDVAEEFSKRMGNRTVEQDTTSKREFLPTMNWSSQTRSTHPVPRPVMLPQEILQMPEGQQIVLRGGTNPVLTERLRSYDDPELRDLVLPPPYVPELVIDVAPDDGTLPVRGVKSDEGRLA